MRFHSMPNPDPTAPTERPPTHTILVVEADIRLRTAVAEYLRQCGFRVLQAGDADEALALLDAAAPIHVLFADVAITGSLDGFGLARRVREILPAVRVILSTGTARTARDAAALCEEQRLLPKPYNHEELARRIRMLLAE
jgi:DNA-binding response OmpR family regulator